LEWNLATGANTLRIAPRNCAGREGIAAEIELTYAASKEK
jgi:hypothetical protein